MSEIYFDEFGCLESLEELSIGAEFALDLDYSSIPEDLQCLTIIFPKCNVQGTNYRRYVNPPMWDVQFVDLDERLNDYYVGKL